ncbi:MAG: reverse transcriptase family protein [Verrucomicrobiales bacterium]|jgi:RNA-directed DNA polymerase|nr:reverse transcriptase family protein [Verrucomicrobiales bacterium]
METWSTHHLYFEALRQGYNQQDAVLLKQDAERLIARGLPVIFTLEHLSQVTRVSVRVLLNSVNRKREAANYRMYAIRKRSGGRRFIHSVSAELFLVQQFINQEILQKCVPHNTSYAFHPTGGIRKCASMHCGARWLFKFDLEDFFYSVTELDVYKIFQSLGYRNLLAFEFSRLCTTIRLPKSFQRRIGALDSYEWLPYVKNGIGVLPQGAPTSPMLSNLVARELDEKLYDYALERGLVYTRYADDITLSASSLSSRAEIGKIIRTTINCIRKAGFRENVRKIQVAGPGSRKVVLGLLVDGDSPKLSKNMYRRIDRHLYASVKFGIEMTAKHEGFDSSFGFYNHLAGLIAYVKDVDEKCWEELSTRLKDISIPWH